MMKKEIAPLTMDQKLLSDYDINKPTVSEKNANYYEGTFFVINYLKLT